MKNLKTLAVALKVFVVAAMLMSSCNNPFFDWEDGGGQGGGKPGKPGKPVITDCNNTGKLVRVTCGTSIYDNLWILTEKGEYLRPCEQSFQTICPIVLHEGDVVKYSVRKAQDCRSCDGKPSCLAAVPPSTNVIVDCITVVPDETCDALTISENAGYNNYVHVIEAKVEGRFLKVKVGYSGCNVLGRNDFKLVWNGSFMESNPLQANLFMDLNSEQTICQAYFTTELCYDISLLKTPTNQQVQINIGEHHILY